MPRLLLDARTVQRKRGGIGRMVEGLVRALVHRAPGLEIVLVTGRRGAEALAGAGPQVSECRVEAGTIDPEFEARILPALVRDLRPDAYHATCFALSEERLPCRTVVTLHDACVRRHPELVRPGLAERIDRATEAALRAADVAVAPSEFSRAELASAYGVDPGRIRVVPNGVEEDFFEEPAPEAVDEVRARRELPERYWLFVGAEDARKGIPEALLGWARHADRRGPDAWPLVIAGGRGGGVREDLVARIAGLSARPAFVRRLGYVTEAELRVLYHRAAGALVLSRYEGFGLPALEALAAGAPLIARGDSSLPEVVGDAGLLLSPAGPEEIALSLATALDRLRDEPGLAERLHTAGPSRARQFPWDRAAQAYLAAYGLAGEGRA